MRKITVKTARPISSNRLLALRRSVALTLAIILLLAGLPWAMVGCEPQPVYGAASEVRGGAGAASEARSGAMTDAEIDNIRQALDAITDENAKQEINKALDEGAEVRLNYTSDGKVKSYTIIREEVSKRFEDMSETEKAGALQLLIDQGRVPNRITVGGTQYSLNVSLWMARGIIVYGDTKEVNNKVSVTAGANYKNGQYRFWGYDINGGLYGNDDFPRDSDSGTPAYEKDWLTTEEIKESAVARGYIGEHGIGTNSRYSEADKRKTAAAWLEENPEWRSAGLDETYIINHFYFNAVLTESGLTNGQFTGVHLSKQSGTLYYQSFSVQGEIPVFTVTEGTVEERVLIPEDDPAQEPETPAEPEQPSDIQVEVELGAPDRTYVGHPVNLTDRSVFTVDGEFRASTKVYGEGLASSKFSLPAGGGTVQKSKTVPTRAEAKFNAPGTYPVKLTVTPKGGSPESDTKTVEVQDVPAIGHSLTGTQKQNRKQVLSLWVATHPDRPLETLWIELKDKESGEVVHLDHHVGSSAGTVNSLENSTSIKTRPIQGMESDELFTNCQLEFLTKNGEEQTFSYTIYAEDGSGKTDLVTAEFTVRPDLAPSAAVALEPTYLREPGTNTARITASDTTATDGDQLARQWSRIDPSGVETPLGVTTPTLNFEDLSFGAGQTIAFEKTGVGPFTVGLKVKDVWTEPTLEEYITEEDRKTGETQASAEVINVAPHVSLEPVETKTADLLFLTTSPAIVEQIRGQLTDVRRTLLEQGIDGKLRVEQILPTGEEEQPAQGTPWKKTMEVNTAFGYQGSWIDFFEKNNYIADDRRLYKIDATWLSSEADHYPQSPYTITAWDGETGEVDWTYTFTSELLTVPNSGPYFAQDDTGTYLYFVSNNQTLILDKTTGSLLTKLNFAVGRKNFVAGSHILTVKTDGIYAIYTGTGALRKIHSDTVGEGATRQSGQIQTVIRRGERLYRGLLDPESQVMTLKPLEGFVRTTSTYSAAKFCEDGSLLVKETGPSLIQFTLYDHNGQILASHQKTGGTMDGAVVNNADGTADYVVYVNNGKASSSKYTTTYTCAELATGKEATLTLTNSNGNPSEARLILAEQVGGDVYAASGGYYTWIYNYGWGNGPTHGYPQRTKTICFDMDSLSALNMGNGTLELDDTKEYGQSFDVYTAIQSGQNGQYQNPPSGNITTLYRRAQTVDQSIRRLTAKYLGDDNGADLQKAFVITEEDLTEEPLYQLVDRQLDYEALDRTKYVKLTAESGAGQTSLTRAIRLEPDTTYYYEYDLYEPEGEGGAAAPGDRAAASFTAEANVARITEDYLTGLQYRVTKRVKEAFDNNTLSEPYFTGIDTAKVKNDRYQVDATSAKYKIISGTAEIKFVVEEGKQAVLSFDYYVDRWAGAAVLADYVLVDGRRWKVPFNSVEINEGHYTHPFLLEPGEHTVKLVTRSYGADNKSLLAIDDITVDYVEPGAPEVTSGRNPLVDPETVRREDLGGGWTRIYGSFTTPKETVAYEGLEGTVKREAGGAGGFTTIGYPQTKTYTLNISVPQGETPVYTSVQTTSKPLYTGSKNFAIEWTVGGTLFKAWHNSYLDGNDKERTLTSELPHNHDFVLPKGWGNSAVRMLIQGGNISGFGSASMDEVILASVIQPDDNTDDRRFFLIFEEETATQGAILTENLTYHGETTIGFVAAEGGSAAGAAGVANLKLYTLADGIRTYVAEEDIADPKELARWTANEGTVEIMEDGTPAELPESMVYAKGQLVQTTVHYQDYEDDPKKVSYYMYTHEPFNDGLHPQAGAVLTEPIERFYVDGKYTLEHWCYDDTGDEAYDQRSNTAALVFYIGGGGKAPWIKSMATDPAKPEEGKDLTLRVAVDDEEKDPLTLRVEVYKDGAQILDQRFTNLTVDASGNYPVSKTKAVTSAEAGSYEVVCTVWDETGTGIAHRQFTIQAAGRIEGEVAHTAAWDSNRRTYNQNLFGSKASIYNEEIVTLNTYLNYSEPRPRGKNVFWAGEELILTAEVGGSPTSITAEAGGYTARLINTGQKNQQGETIYKGTLWSSSMRTVWGKTPEEVEVLFKAYYESGEPKEHRVKIVLDSNTEYWLLHRYW